MFPQFQRVVTLSVMGILVGLFAWIYLRDRQPRARLWMIGWAAVVVHFAGMMLVSFKLIPDRLADWLAYATLIAAASAFFLSVCRGRWTLPDRIVFWAGIVAPAVAYWTLLVLDAKTPLVYRALLAFALGCAGWLTWRQPSRSLSSIAACLCLAVLPGLWTAWRVATNPESGINFLLCAGFAITAWRYWRYFHRLSPGVLLTSLAFLAWGLVFPVAEICEVLGINIPGDHVVWDLPKYFVAFGMIVTLFENQTEVLQVEVSERKRAEEVAQAANEAKGILMASVSFAARRILGTEGWEKVIPEALSKLGTAARVGRAYVAQVHPAEPGLVGAIRHEWINPELARQMAGFRRTRVAWSGKEGYVRSEGLRRGEVVAFYSQEGEQPLTSILLAPIEVAGAWFGFLGFEDPTRERRWTEAEQDGFRAAGRMLGASITRQRAQEYVDNILHSMGESLLVTDAELRIRRVNPSTLRMLGYREEELIGRPAGQVIREHELHARRNAVERTYRTKSGKSIPVLFSSAEMRNGAGVVEGYVWLAQDMTELKRVQGELVRARDAAEDANRAKSAFLANMSHELRTPLNAVIGYSEMLQDIAVDQGQPDLLPDLARIRAAGKHLLGLIDDVLDLSKIEAGKVALAIETLEVARVVDEAVDTVRPLLMKNRNRLEAYCEQPLGNMLGDPTRVRQILFNLLSNACKFTDNGVVRLEARRLRRDGSEWVEFQVHDTGIGMSQEQLGRLYQPFTQADASTTRRYGGTGLGLTISRVFCQMMGGSLNAESELGRGSVFTVLLPGDAAIPVATSAGAPGFAEMRGLHA